MSTNHIVIDRNEDCYGCTACYAVCPQDAIQMVEDEEGFKYPQVNTAQCIDCGVCISRCPVQIGNQHGKTDSFYAVTHTQETVRGQSSSGGIFSALAQDVVKNNGVVYGAAFDSDFAVRHIRTDGHTWMKLRTSKYVQSDLGDTFAQVKVDLKAGLPVLFTGTPCQVDGLNHFLKNVDTSRLITCDLVCHGVPSPKIWREYLTQLEKKQKRKIGKVNFRNKEGCGWHNPTIKIESTDGTVLLNETHDQSSYLLLFCGHVILRESCFSCRYANLHRAGDITIGDYWGVEKYHPELDDDKGLSLVMVNSEKGRDMLKKITADCWLTPLAEQECLQPNLISPSQDYGAREVFWKAHRRFGLNFATKRVFLCDMNLFEKLFFTGLRIFSIISGKIKRSITGKKQDKK